MDEEQGAAPQGTGETRAPTASFAIERIYTKDLSLENPGAPQSFQITEPPQVEVGMRTRGEQIGEDVYEFVLTLTDGTTHRASFAGRCVRHSRASAGAAAAGDGDQLSERSVSLCARSDRRCDDACRLPAHPSRTDQFRSALPGTDGEAAGTRGHELTQRLVPSPL